MPRYTISQFFTLGRGDGHGKVIEKSSLSYAVIDNVNDEIVAEFETEAQAQDRIDSLIGLVGVAEFACPTCGAESKEWCFRWRTDRDGTRYKEVMGGSLLTCPDRLRLTQEHNRQAQELNTQGEHQ